MASFLRLSAIPAQHLPALTKQLLCGLPVPGYALALVAFSGS